MYTGWARVSFCQFADSVCPGDKVHVHTLETQLARTTEELKGLKVRQQELETKLSQAQWQNEAKADVRAALMLCCLWHEYHPLFVQVFHQNSHNEFCACSCK